MENKKINIERVLTLLMFIFHNNSCKIFAFFSLFSAANLLPIDQIFISITSLLSDIIYLQNCCFLYDTALTLHDMFNQKMTI